MHPCYRDRASRQNGVKSCYPLSLQGIEAAAFGLLIKVFEYVADDLTDAVRVSHRFLSIDGRDIFILHIVFHLHCVDVIDAEGQHVPIIDSINNGIGVQLFPKGLWRGSHQRIATTTGIGRKDGCPSKAEQVIMLKGLHNFAMHITELGAMTFVKDYDHVLFKDIMAFIL